MNFKEMLKEKIHLYDGSKGFLFMQQGLAAGEYPDAWNIGRPDVVYGIHKAYVDAGADVIQTNTLQGSGPHLEAVGLYEKLADINTAGVALAKKAAHEGAVAAGKAGAGTACTRTGGKKVLVAASIGPLGGLMAPFGDMQYDEAYAAFREQIEVIIGAGADILHFETFTDLSELRIAVTAARDVGAAFPVIATVSVESNGRTVMGDNIEYVCAALAALNVDCAGANCGLPPGEMLKRFAPFANFSAPLCSKPNAGTPSMVDGAASYDATDEEFYETAFGFAKLGARLIGGCCGSGPSHVRRMRTAVDAMNADTAYSYANIIGDRAAKNDDGCITLHAPGKQATLSREAIANFVRAGETEKGMQGHSPDGSIQIVDLAQEALGGGGFDVAEALSDAFDSDSEATVFRLATSGLDGKAKAEAAGLYSQVAEDARVYHKKPVIFYTDDADALGGALRRYCGVPAVIAAKGDAGRIRGGVGHFNIDIIEI